MYERLALVARYFYFPYDVHIQAMYWCIHKLRRNLGGTPGSIMSGESV